MKKWTYAVELKQGTGLWKPLGYHQTRESAQKYARENHAEEYGQKNARVTRMVVDR